jgi:hypothetical protein
VSTIFGQFSLEMLFFVHLQHVVHLGGSSVELTVEAYKKQHFEFSYKETFFSTRTETHTNYTEFER